MKGLMEQHASQREIVLKPCFDEPILSVMNFLNEVVLDHPTAISFAPGRPLERLFNVRDHVSDIAEAVEAEAAASTLSAVDAWGRLGQYDRTNGRINELVAQHLAIDEGIHASPESIIVTVGAQEAMAILLAGLFELSRDVLLVSDPTYIGITGLALVLGIPVVPVASGPNGLEPRMLRDAIATVSSAGQRVRAVYDIPDFNNPLGTSLPLPARTEILTICHDNEVLYLEDSAYGMFAYDTRPPSLKALDRHGDVIYIGSFSKTLFPGLRLGYLVADQRVRGSGQVLAQALSKVKSLISVNTSGLCQAVAAATLLRHGGSLEPVVAPKRAQVRRQRDAMLDALAREFAGMPGAVHWTHPSGGYFLTVTFPFPFGPEELVACVADYGVIPCPMRFFTLGNGRHDQVRLSFSYVGETEIAEGVRRLAQFVRDKIGGDLPAQSSVG
jgi:(S)-3,5-dihydroxyphenylglycine transaminase